MAGFISKQPNGLYCRFSTVVDCPTHYNMTKDNYIEVIQSRGVAYKYALIEAEDVLNNHLKSFQEVIDRFVPNNMTQEEFDKWLKEVGYK